MNTIDFIKALRADIKKELRDEILAELEPIIQAKLYTNILTFDEAKQYLKVSESTLRKQVYERKIPFFKQRGNYYFRQIDLDRHIDGLVIQNK